MKKHVLQLTVVGLIKMDLIGLEQRLIISTNRFPILMDKITIKCFMFLPVLERISKKLKRVFIFKLTELEVRRPKRHLNQICCYNKMAQAMIAQKKLEVDTNLQKIDTDMITKFRVAKEKKHRKLTKPIFLSG